MTALQENVHEATLIEETFDRLWPILRSITGEGVRQSHDILSEIAPLRRYEFESGKQVLDWVVPSEWRVHEAYVITPDGRRILDVHENNLHLLNYSTAYKGNLSRKELDEHLFSIPEQPHAIPYKTSYYTEQWGFCIAHDERQSLPDGEYQIVIDTEHVPGSLTVSEAVLPGEEDGQVLFTSYTCHPSLAINELSGPLLLAFLYRRIAAWRDRRLTYRFVFGPETIGAICFLSKFGDELIDRLVAGYVVTCVGDDGPITFKHSRRHTSLADRAALHVLHKHGLKYEPVKFNPSGSDERQFCSLGFDLPVASLMRTAYCAYPQYHTSDDNKSLMDFEAMTHTLDIYEDICRTIDRSPIVRNKVTRGEPQFSRRGDIYPRIGLRYADNALLALKWLIHFADGNNDLLSIAEMSGLDLDDVWAAANRGIEVDVFERLSK